MFILLIVVLAGVVHAQTNNNTGPGCADTDESAKDPFAQQGSVKYGITTQQDTCLTGQEGVSINNSKWLKEYYCSGEPAKRESKVIDCTREKYIGCVNGACKSGTGANVTGSQKTSTPVKTCGDKILAKDKGEECDPPGNICFGKTSKQYGQCGPDCKCKIASAAEKPVAACGDDVKDEGEDCEKDSECQANFVCSSCKCVKQLTPEEIEAMKGKPILAPSTSENETATPVLDLTPKNFTESAGVKATSSIAGFFRSVFGWIATIFS